VNPSVWVCDLGTEPKKKKKQIINKNITTRKINFTNILVVFSSTLTDGKGNPGVLT
jgi:hypothetical protein